MRYLKTAFTLLAIVAVFTYRIWPRPLQNIVFYLLLFLTLGLIGLEVIRFAIFLVCYLFGYRIWIFPDLDRDDKGIFGVFTPLISVEVGKWIGIQPRKSRMDTLLLGLSSWAFWERLSRCIWRILVGSRADA